MRNCCLGRQTRVGERAKQETVRRSGPNLEQDDQEGLSASLVTLSLTPQLSWETLTGHLACKLKAAMPLPQRGDLGLENEKQYLMYWGQE